MSKLTGRDPSLLRRINSTVVLRALRGTTAPAALTLTELVRATELSRPTVEGVVEDLIEAGLVAERPRTRRRDRAARRAAGARRGASGSARRRASCWAWRSGRTGWRPSSRI